MWSSIWKNRLESRTSRSPNVAKKEEGYKDRRKRAERPWKRDEFREGRKTAPSNGPVKPSAPVPIKNCKVLESAWSMLVRRQG